MPQLPRGGGPAVRQTLLCASVSECWRHEGQIQRHFPSVGWCCARLAGPSKTLLLYENLTTQGHFRRLLVRLGPHILAVASGGCAAGPWAPPPTHTDKPHLPRSPCVGASGTRQGCMDGNAWARLDAALFGGTA
ncbi:hypothetical protein NDU88_003930 [Pleurodeles waltl]|uniref:Uncharacterized protein n=1 Tax=Pleurodeles waltl TaxID=8319 RepID=A0AAV7WTM9_PLEWA|nr:hypothetical protein NDU88_003930 [Pleurodeles waltl]